ncbi:hypothetical protein UFOVP1082_12 [uncultured Caudovirales phage]|uniref:DUF6378 domain-containing protein n=1 Tax=uncultured Caudovirales phage TaxID=2100421 RepID=A0A6J5SFF3_9CAUD|nr:hypothetical protein UFOVP906_49 [uncultured Caudovirales phage]CAB4176281.1 hypothetical protein UFOVP992_16 [uncultured Caudovirales phage]CAB4183027.1 hypothetical protein UFOVP1082_12 [uncultured Caudovirales phage]CAB4198040.1 hypothetical protein UFOVP1322_56 [uncultured Caudovirales phage]CAB4212431.1 hypothetical protein UFOVP1434_19 [uncultured Caudovirales phage]
MTNIFNIATKIVEEKSKMYGGQKEGFEKTAMLWTALLGVPISSKQVVMMFMANKMSRESFCHTQDNLIDIAGYAQVLENLEEESKERIAYRRACLSSGRQDLYRMYRADFETKWKEKFLIDELVKLDLAQAMHSTVVNIKE